MLHRTVMIALVAGLAGVAAAERVNTFIFENAENGDVSGLNIWIDVLDQGSHAEFVVHNDSSVASFVSAVYFEQTDFSQSALLDGEVQDPQPAGVKFQAKSGKPAGSVKNFGGDWAGTLFGAKAKSPGQNKDGIDPGEYAVFEFDYGSYSFQDIIDALSGDNPAFRIAQHIQGVNGDFSVWALNDGITTQSIPLPSAAGLSLAGLGLLGLRRRR